jgi:phage protein U
MSISETYHLPPIGTSGQRSAVAPHDDTISLSAVLLGKERFAWKFALETMAEASKRGTALGAIPGAPLGTGLVLITSLTIRTDMQVQSLSFTASAARRDTLDVSISLVHVPSPGWLNQALAAASVAVGALTDFSGV